MKTAQNGAAWLIFVVLLAGIACRLTSPTPAAWSKTPTAQAQAATNTAEAMLRRATFVSGGETLSTPFPTETAQITREPQTQPVQSDEGPWLVYAAKETGILRAYDIGMGKVIEINLPTPIYIEDLIQGHYPGDRYLFIRAGSPLITDELALYQVDLLSNEIKKISPLLSISLQRRIVNQLGTRALETLQAVTQPNGLAWSRDRHFLAFTAALHNDSSDLYVFDTTHDRLQRLNGLFTQNATPFWSPENTWLISQELGNYDPERGWRAENVSGLRIPAFDDQNSLYLPGRESRGEVFVGWLNSKNFVSYSQTADGPQALRRVNVDTQVATLIFPGRFKQAAFDSASGTLAFTLGEDEAMRAGMMAGIYLFEPDSSDYRLHREGEWEQLVYDQGGMFVTTGSQGALAFTSDEEEIYLPGEVGVRMSPLGNWIVAWGNGEGSTAGARLYQPASDRPLQTLTDMPVTSVYWQPDSKGFFLYGESALYYLRFPSLNMEEIEGGFIGNDILELIWVE